MKKHLLMLVCCFVLMLSACGKHDHSYNEADCVNAAICTSCGEEIAPALGHTTKIGTCSRCGEVQNESLLALINDEYAQIMNTGEDLIACVTGVTSLSNDEQYKVFQTADDYVAKMKELYSDIIDSCSPEDELGFLVYQTKLLDNTCPPKISGNDSTSLANQTVLYQLYLQQISSSFNYLSTEMNRLAGNDVNINAVEYFGEVPEMPTPDSVIFDISYDSKKTDSGVIQYMYLLGKDETDANMNYNNYLSAIGMDGKLKVTIEDTYCYVTKNGTMVSAMMAGEDATKGFFLIVSFQE